MKGREAGCGDFHESLRRAQRGLIFENWTQAVLGGRCIAPAAGGAGTVVFFA